jgi:hypothetical protein
MMLSEYLKDNKNNDRNDDEKLEDAGIDRYNR